MKAERGDLAQALARGLEAEREALAEDVMPDEIVAYQLGELDGERAEAVRALLSADPELAKTLLTLRDPEALAALENVAPDTDDDIDSGWKDLMSRLEAEERLDVEETVETEPVPAIAGESSGAVIHEFPAASSRPPTAAPQRPSSSPWALAAVFVLGCALTSLAFLVSPDLTGPEPPPQIRLVQLDPLRPDAGPLRSGGGEESARAGVEEGQLIVLQLWPPTALERQGALAERVTAQLFHNETPLGRFEASLQDGAYVLSLSPELLAPGRYRVELVDPEGVEVASYLLDWR